MYRPIIVGRKLKAKWITPLSTAAFCHLIPGGEPNPCSLSLFSHSRSPSSSILHCRLSSVIVTVIIPFYWPSFLSSHLSDGRHNLMNMLMATLFDRWQSLMHILGWWRANASIRSQIPFSTHQNSILCSILALLCSRTLCSHVFEFMERTRHFCSLSSCEDQFHWTPCFP